jgi:hypothetical protein
MGRWGASKKHRFMPCAGQSVFRARPKGRCPAVQLSGRLNQGPLEAELELELGLDGRGASMTEARAHAAQALQACLTGRRESGSGVGNPRPAAEHARRLAGVAFVEPPSPVGAENVRNSLRVSVRSGAGGRGGGSGTEGRPKGVMAAKP